MYVTVQARLTETPLCTVFMPYSQKDCFQAASFCRKILYFAEENGLVWRVFAVLRSFILSRNVLRRHKNKQSKARQVRPSRSEPTFMTVWARLTETPLCTVLFFILSRNVLKRHKSEQDKARQMSLGRRVHSYVTVQARLTVNAVLRSFYAFSARSISPSFKANSVLKYKTS